MLTPIDTKRHILDNGIDTLAFGHYKITEIKEDNPTLYIEAPQQPEPIMPVIDVEELLGAFGF